MITLYRKSLLVAIALLPFAFPSIGNADTVEAIYGLDVSNPAVVVGALNKLFESDAMDGHVASLWATEFNGSNPTTHVIAADFDDYAAYEAMTAKRRGSPDWLSYVLTTGDAISITGSTLAIERVATGGNWQEDGALAAFSMTVSDPARYATEFRKLIAAMDNPGSVRLLEVRAGGDGTTHYAVITAPNMTELNEYLDELLGSSAYRSFVQAVRPIRTISTVNMYRRVMSWD